MYKKFEVELTLNCFNCGREARSVNILKFFPRETHPCGITYVVGCTRCKMTRNCTYHGIPRIGFPDTWSVNATYNMRVGIEFLREV